MQITVICQTRNQKVLEVVLTTPNCKILICQNVSSFVIESFSFMSWYKYTSKYFIRQKSK